MADYRPSRPEDNLADVSAALDATIERNAAVVRRARRRVPAFLKKLGLKLPVTEEDVRQAFYAKARETHPDRRGDARAFMEVQKAFDEAIEFARQNGRRLPWLGSQLPYYIAQRRVASLVDRWGGKVVLSQIDWLEETVGEDFSKLAERLLEIDLTRCDVGDKELDELTADPHGIQYLETLGLAFTKVTDASIFHIVRASNLKNIDLRGTEVSFALRRRLAELPHMHVEGASRWQEFWRNLLG